MDKQKQIEEIAKELCPHYADGKCYYETNEVSTCDCECEFCWSVSVLLKAGYRKITEAVVLTDDEYERWQGETLNIKKVRKEMAEKFAERLKELVLNYCGTVEENGYFTIGKKGFCREIDEICKEIVEGKV